MINKEQDFLIKYGIHNFVTVKTQGNSPIFLIERTMNPKMISHAQNLIQGAYGTKTKIKHT